MRPDRRGEATTLLVEFPREELDVGLEGLDRLEEIPAPVLHLPESEAGDAREARNGRRFRDGHRSTRALESLGHVTRDDAVVVGLQGHGPS